jgi:hypothetical protein
MKLFYVCTFLILFFLIIPNGNATEEMAEKMGKDCSYCHLDQSGGGELTKAGKEYLTKESESDEDAQGKGILHYIRFIAGFLHIFTAIFWFGTILYVHLILKPQYAARGLPRGEVKVGFVSMIVMAVTGITLTVFRVPSFLFLFEIRFGILLLWHFASCENFSFSHNGLFSILCCTNRRPKIRNEERYKISGAQRILYS